ncbi:Bifunctional (p)ppGpp synthase/hydrolase relA [Clostridium sp. C105KSO15]|nr:Bifunctional (p)ppGpp synthase/hydrolase relA [Clostridium sp. C105KSO15]
MEKENWVLACAVYIDEHLKEELSVERISAWAGYSPWYFSRRFKAQMGVSPMEYVKQRRLFAAAGEIRRGKRIIDVALDYGWETHSGFTKAFCGRFGYAPVLLRAIYICDASMEGEREHMELYLKTMETYKKTEELWEILCQTLRENKTEHDQENLIRIYELASSCHKGQKRYSGEDYITHSLNVALILSDMGADEETVCAGLMHDAESGIWEEELKGEVTGERILNVLLAYREFEGRYESHDERGALIALADRLHNMRTIEFVDPSTWKRRAEDTMKIFSPIAAKCGDIRLRSELDELSMKFL